MHRSKHFWPLNMRKKELRMLRNGANSAIRKLRRMVLQTRLRRGKFSIVTNNCWGAHIYQELGIPYQTPFVGIFISPDSYLQLLTRLRYYLNSPLGFIPRSSEDWINEIRDRDTVRWPIGILGDGIELQFMHYRNEAEAREKWQRRLLRFTQDDDQVFVKFCDIDKPTPAQIERFDSLPWTHKVFFAARPSSEINSCMVIPCHTNRVPDGFALSKLSPRYFDTARWLMRGDGKITWWLKYLNCI
jgi:uncharacterized protein (DUF1919 family)